MNKLAYHLAAIIEPKENYFQLLDRLSKGPASPGQADVSVKIEFNQKPVWNAAPTGIVFIFDRLTNQERAKSRTTAVTTRKRTPEPDT